MRILVTGANGYIGKRLVPKLAEAGHELICCVRDASRYYIPESIKEKITVFEIDFLDGDSAGRVTFEFDAAYYLIHSMESSIGRFAELESKTAENFVRLVRQGKAKQVIFLSGLIGDESGLSAHLESRLNVENILKSGGIPLTILRAGIIVGSGSASFEIIRDLVEKLPVMITPKWVSSKCQPIAASDVVRFLTGVLGNRLCFDKTYDIGGPEVLTYQDMLEQYAEVRKLRRYIFNVPVMTPRLSSYWLIFITATSYKLAVNLVNSMKINVVCGEKKLEEILGIKPVDYKTAIRKAFDVIEQNLVVSSWKDALSSSSELSKLSDFINVPVHGCFKDMQKVRIEGSEEKVINKIWAIGGDKGWYYADILWELRGIMDKLSGGVGLRRGRTNPDEIRAGEALDFWRVLLADKKSGRLLLYAEMKLPGEAWLEFNIKKENGTSYLYQAATFRPNGLLGRVYWYSLLPAHFFIFRNMAKRIARN